MVFGQITINNKANFLPNLWNHNILIFFFKKVLKGSQLTIQSYIRVTHWAWKAHTFPPTQQTGHKNELPSNASTPVDRRVIQYTQINSTQIIFFQQALQGLRAETALNEAEGLPQIPTRLRLLQQKFW